MDDVQLAVALGARAPRRAHAHARRQRVPRCDAHAAAAATGLHYCDLLGHPIDAVARVSGPAGDDDSGRPARPRLELLRRIEAIEFAVRFDDGVGPRTALEGRRSSSSWACRGARRLRSPSTSAIWGTRPRTCRSFPGVEPPRELEEIDPRTIVGLTIDAESLAAIRGERARGLPRRQTALSPTSPRSTRSSSAPRQIHRRLGCPVIEVSNLAIEETARRIIRLVGAAAASRGRRVCGHEREAEDPDSLLGRFWMLLLAPRPLRLLRAPDAGLDGDSGSSRGWRSGETLSRPLSS